MLLKYVYDPALAHASYLVGCQRSGEAIIVDPGRDIEPYLKMAKREGVKITAVAETHIHADYVSGAREMADRIGAKLYLSDEGPAEWKYLYANQYDSQLLKNGDSFFIGNIRFTVMHTPGHTPESISFLLTDEGGGASEPMGIFTGDFVFVGSIGRPDLLEEAAGVVGSAAEGAHALYASVKRFRELPDYLQVWPAHGAGSACGKGLGAVPSSTVGYEKLFNPALQYDDEDSFVAYILADQPEAPKYFAVMKRVNKEGPAILGPPTVPVWQDMRELPSALSEGQVIDLRHASDFAKAHVPGTLNIPARMLAAWAGWIVDYNKPLYLIAGESQAEEAQRVLRELGMDCFQGYFAEDDVAAADVRTESYASAEPAEVRSRIEDGEVLLVDVRPTGEWNAGHIPQAQHLFLGKLIDTGRAVAGDRTIVTQCLAGGRSAIAASILQSFGADVINLTGGIQAWQGAGFPIEVEQAACATPSSCATN